ncbi:hypothetical protein PR202_gb22317 [Eleusine coracana subsp. coracana]|uniref:Uncharacterized protein n=1 Tax=Eleusine coracana subsp. coracana TaxID=191504 RepID=A0AAV5FFY3_ELECO|nr:hypothetical protein PR202_gb22317 [Eleusine coracana subsp. coracana]
MASSSGTSSPWTSGDLILAASHGRPIAAYDALTGHAVAELPAANTPRHGLAVAAVAGASFVAASNICPATGAASIRLLQWCSPAPARELPVPEPVSALVAAPYGPYLLAGGVSGHVHALALPRRSHPSRVPRASGRRLRRADGARRGRAPRGQHAAPRPRRRRRGGRVLRRGVSNICPATGAASIRLLQWCSPAPARELPVPEPVSALVAAPYGPYLLAGGVSGHVHALALPSGHVARSFPAHIGHIGGGVTCLAVNDDGSFLFSGGDNGALAAFLLLDVLDVEAAEAAAPPPQTTSPCTATTLYAGGSDGRVHVAPLTSRSTVTTTSSTSDGGTGAAALVGVAVTNGWKSLVSCSEDGEARVWDLPGRGHGLVHVTTFWLGGAVSGVLVVKKHSGEAVAGTGGGGEGLRVRDDVAWTRAREVVEMERMLRASEEDRASSVALLETNLDIHKRCLRLMRREAGDVANGERRDGNVSD